MNKTVAHTDIKPKVRKNIHTSPNLAVSHIHIRVPGKNEIAATAASPLIILGFSEFMLKWAGL
jgi:hypothetical protein